MPLINQTFSQLITFTRASGATYFDATGTLQTAATNVPRLDYNPSTLAAQGLLIEEARTNSIRNNTMQGAVAGTPGTVPTNWSVSEAAGLTTNVIGTGTTNGITWIDVQVTGTPTSPPYTLQFEPTNQIAAAPAQNWTASAWVAIVGGSTTNLSGVNFRLQTYTSGSTFIAQVDSADVTLTSTLTRSEGTYSNLPATTAFIVPRLRIRGLTIGQAIDITLRIGLPQLEQGAFATSVIPTTTTALTRNADVASVNTLSPWYNQTEGTVYAELQSLSPLTSGQSVALGKYPNVWSIEAGASDSNLFWYGVASEAYISATYNNIGVVPSGINKLAISLAPSGGQSRSSLNGAAAVNRSGTLTGTATGFFLGRDSTAGLNNFLNGYLRRIVYYPRALSGAELQSITS